MSGKSDKRKITVTGLGEVEASPDMATLTFGISALNKHANKAMNEVGTLSQKFMKVLTDAAIESAHIRTSRMAVKPKVDYDTKKRTGFVATNMLSVTIHNLEILPALLDALGKAGMNELSTLEFACSDAKTYENDALVLAMNDAKARAELIAQTAGVAVGAPLEIDTRIGGHDPSPRMRAAAMDVERGAMPVAEGQIKFSARVQVVYELLP